MIWGHSRWGQMSCLMPHTLGLNGFQMYKLISNSLSLDAGLVTFYMSYIELSFACF